VGGHPGLRVRWLWRELGSGKLLSVKIGYTSVYVIEAWPSGAGHRRRGRTGGARVHEHVLPGAAEELGVDLEGGYPRAGVRSS